MITIHHLGMSQSDRIVWLMEELNLPYSLKWYDRKDQLAPPEYLALHPASTAPVIDDDGRVLAESAVIVEYICHRYAGGALTVAPTQPNYAEYLYWMHFNNNVQGLFFAKLALGPHPMRQRRVPASSSSGAKTSTSSISTSAWRRRRISPALNSRARTSWSRST